VPQSAHEWTKISHEFWTQWNFPNCLGALDGKHVQLIPPPNSGSLYYNYKHFNSIVLLALVDAGYKFLYVDVGSYGRTSDGGVYNSSELAAAISCNAVKLPNDSCLPQSDQTCPHVIVADDAFALKRFLMKPYASRNLTPSQRIYNYRLSRARRVVENAFGIMCSRFRVFGKAMNLGPEKVQNVVLATCCLHNFLLRNPTSAAQYMPDDQDPASNLASISNESVNRASNDALLVRDTFCQYFNSAAGAVSWQDKVLKL